jgi:NIMA (never in mitosis gene a)-related kinase 1/4/5
VVSYKEAFYDDKSEMLCIVMEFANHGDLQGKIKKAQTIKGRIPEEDIWSVAYNVL